MNVDDDDEFQLVEKLLENAKICKREFFVLRQDTRVFIMKGRIS
jgi:hypothetical protein